MAAALSQVLASCVPALDLELSCGSAIGVADLVLVGGGGDDEDGLCDVAAAALNGALVAFAGPAGPGGGGDDAPAETVSCRGPLLDVSSTAASNAVTGGGACSESSSALVGTINAMLEAAVHGGPFSDCQITTVTSTATTSPTTTTTPTSSATTTAFAGRFMCELPANGDGPVAVVSKFGGESCDQQVAVINSALDQCGGLLLAADLAERRAVLPASTPGRKAKRSLNRSRRRSDCFEGTAYLTPVANTRGKVKRRIERFAVGSLAACLAACDANGDCALASTDGTTCVLYTDASFAAKSKPGFNAFVRAVGACPPTTLTTSSTTSATTTTTETELPTTAKPDLTTTTGAEPTEAATCKGGRVLAEAAATNSGCLLLAAQLTLLVREFGGCVNRASFLISLGFLRGGVVQLALYILGFVI
jgi:hypothetical protein